MEDEEEFQKWYNRALHFLKFRPRSRSEICTFLSKKKTPEKIIDQLLEKLEQLNLVNDQEFAKWFVEQRATFRPKGKALLTLELRQKGISPDTISEVLEGLDATSQSRAAEKLIERKLFLWRTLDPRLRRKKAQDFLLRRGFSWEIVKIVFKRVIDASGEKE